MARDQIKVTYEDHNGSDLKVVNAARVSYGRRSKWDCNVRGENVLKPADKSLLQFLARGYTADDYDDFIAKTIRYGRYAYDTMKYDDCKLVEDLLWEFRDKGEHKSPFNHCFATFVVDAPMFVARQLVKHEYLPWNEMSGRYIELTDVYMPDQFRSKVRDKKQGSGAAIDDENYFALEAIFHDQHKSSFKAYKDAIDLDLCEEQARGLLPLNTMTSWWWSGSLGAFAKMCRLRLAPDAQEESRWVAEQISAKMLELYPVSWSSLVLRDFA